MKMSRAALTMCLQEPNMLMSFFDVTILEADSTVVEVEMATAQTESPDKVNVFLMRLNEKLRRLVKVDVMRAKPCLILGDGVDFCAEEFGCDSGAVGKKIYKTWRTMGLRGEGAPCKSINDTAKETLSREQKEETTLLWMENKQ
jgi:hypothetical protein